MNARLIQVGNSKGVRLPKAVLEQAGLVDAIRIEVTREGVLISPARNVREGWAEAAKQLHEAGLDEPLGYLPTAEDENWTW